MTDKDDPLFAIDSNSLKSIVRDLTKVGFKSLDDNVLSKCKSKWGRDLLGSISSALSETIQNNLVSEAKILTNRQTEEKARPAIVTYEKVDEAITQDQEEKPVQVAEELKFD